MTLPEPEPRPATSLHAVFRLQDLLSTLDHRAPEPYRLITTLDRDWQDRVTLHAVHTLNSLTGRGAENAGVIVVETRNMTVRAWLGSVDYFDEQHHGAIDYNRLPRSPGSTLKPFIYAAALDRGVITPATILEDITTGLGGTINADRAFLGPLLPRQALANSRNVPAVALANAVGLDTVYNLFHDLQLHDYEHPARDYGLGLALGAMPITLEQLVTAYSVLVNDGRYQPLQWQPTSSVNGIPPDPSPRLTSGTARLITLFLADPSARLPTFPRMGTTEYPFPVALKTGTSQGLRDAWTLAYSNRFLIGVWIGNADHRPMSEVSGATAAALAQRILLDLHGEDRQGFADLSFPPPANYVPARLCALTGKLATPGCEHIVTEWFPPQDVPVEADSTPLLMTVARHGVSRNHPGAVTYPMTQRNWINLPTKYAQWANRRSANAQAVTTGSLNPLEALLTSGTDPKITVTAPSDGNRLLRDPTLPSNYSTLALRATVEPPTPQLLWIIDGQPFQLAGFPYTIRWPLKSGTHTIQAEVPNTVLRSDVIRVNVE